jgi:group I intron endonuclease
MFVYVIVCSETLKIYIGQHKGDDLKKYLSKKYWDAHYYSGKRSHIYAAMRKHPRESWSIHPLISGIESRNELDETERLLIYALKSQHPDVGYNICDGGEGFTGPQSESARAKISASLREQYKNGRHMSDEGRASVGAKNRQHGLGRHSSEETRKKQSQALKGNPACASRGMLGRKHSEATLTQMRESAKRRGISPETRAKITASRKGYSMPAETRAKIAVAVGNSRFIKTVAWG